MDTALALSRPNSLLGILNVIFIGIVIYIATNRFTYIINVMVYAIAKSVIPILITLIFARMIGLSIEIGIGAILGSMLILCIPYFIIGLLVIKVIEKITDWFSSDTIIWFIVSFAVVDSIISWIFVAFLSLLFL